MSSETFCNPKRKPIRDQAHLRFIRTLPCVVCGVRSCDAAHVSFGNYTRGLGQKADDCYTVPLCHKHHMEQHAMPERAWWQQFGFDDPNELALLLYKHTGNRYICNVLICAVRAIAKGQVNREPLIRMIKDA